MYIQTRDVRFRTVKTKRGSPTVAVHLKRFGGAASTELCRASWLPPDKENKNRLSHLNRLKSDCPSRSTPMTSYNCRKETAQTAQH